jgi:hypothetical protein
MACEHHWVQHMHHKPPAPPSRPDHLCPPPLALQVPAGSPADQAGLQPTKRGKGKGQDSLILGDIITGIDGKAVKSYKVGEAGVGAAGQAWGTVLGRVLATQVAVCTGPSPGTRRPILSLTVALSTPAGVLGWQQAVNGWHISLCDCPLSHSI